MRPSSWIVVVALAVLGAILVEGVEAQNQDPRIGVWQNANNPGNVMNYDEIPGGGTRLRVDAVNAAGEVTSWWGYDAFFDGEWHPVTGTNRTAEEEDAWVELKNPFTTEIRYRRPAGGMLDRVLENVVSPDGETLWVIFRNPEGIATNIVTYNRVR
ncbi:MAG: hypothetical protein EA421_16155 [Gemmatimonadales bacterium]|nr:MAG: hypothetical protein EA421_16155 [Gemmatimonadales bacterium]